VSKSPLARELIFSLIVNPNDTTLAPSPPEPQPPLPSSPSSSNLSPTHAIPKEFSLFHKLLSLMTSLEEYSKRYASEFLFSLCDSDGLPPSRPLSVSLCLTSSFTLSVLSKKVC
jgi:hypothetical protein